MVDGVRLAHFVDVVAEGLPLHEGAHLAIDHVGQLL